MMENSKKLEELGWQKFEYCGYSMYRKHDVAIDTFEQVYFKFSVKKVQYETFIDLVPRYESEGPIENLYTEIHNI